MAASSWRMVGCGWMDGPAGGRRPPPLLMAQARARGLRNTSHCVLCHSYFTICTLPFARYHQPQEGGQNPVKRLKTIVYSSISSKNVVARRSEWQSPQVAESQMAQYINGKWSEDMAGCPDANVHLADGGGHPTIRSSGNLIK